MGSEPREFAQRALFSLAGSTGMFISWSLFLIARSSPNRRPLPDRRLSAQHLDWRASYDTKMLELYAQVARDTASFLSTMQESVTPAQLQRLVENNLLQHQEIYGSCIAFEPNSYAMHNVSGGVPSASGVDAAGNSFWTNAAMPWTLPLTELWHEHAGAVLYAPYAARGPGWRAGQQFSIFMDLADGYNYWDLDVEWFHVARTMFLEGELSLTRGLWGAPYFDEGAGRIEMVTFSVPFWRDRPVQDVDQPDREQAPYGCPLQQPVSDYHGKAVYFWGIATIDIDLKKVMFTCGAGMIFREGFCKKCSDYEYASEDGRTCLPCEEGAKSSENGTGCEQDMGYMLILGSFCVATGLVVFNVIYYVLRSFHILSIGQEEDHLVLRTSLNHGIRFQTITSCIEVSFSDTGISSLDRPTGPLYVTAFDNTGVELVDRDRNPLLLSPGNISGKMRLARYDSFWNHTGVFVNTGLGIVLCSIAALVLAAIGAFSFRLGISRVLQSFGIAFILAAISGGLTRNARRYYGWKAQQAHHSRVEQASALRSLALALWDAEGDLVEASKDRLLQLGWTLEDVNQFCAGTMVEQSANAGVCVAYLLSDKFHRLAATKSGVRNPTFYNLKDSFFFGDHPIGKDILCPRDGKPGCALVDTLERQYRKDCTHFLSWTWQYTIDQVHSGLKGWTEHVSIDPSHIFLFMCFFVNNQYRILVHANSSGSDRLEEVFEPRLRKIGRMVALLDDWREPVYLSRIWTIFEQYIAKALDLEIEIIMPEPAHRSLISQIQRGQAGILEVKKSLLKVDSRNAKAFDPKDDRKVKRIISKNIGFDAVDENIRSSMLDWVGYVVQTYMRKLMKEGETHEANTGILERSRGSRETPPGASPPDSARAVFDPPIPNRPLESRIMCPASEFLADPTVSSASRVPPNVTIRVHYT